MYSVILKGYTITMITREHDEGKSLPLHQFVRTQTVDAKTIQLYASIKEGEQMAVSLLSHLKYGISHLILSNLMKDFVNISNIISNPLFNPHSCNGNIYTKGTMSQSLLQCYTMTKNGGDVTLSTYPDYNSLWERFAYLVAKCLPTPKPEKKDDKKDDKKDTKTDLPVPPKKETKTTKRLQSLGQIFGYGKTENKAEDGGDTESIEVIGEN